MYDIIIIGAGMAGLTAAIYARRASKKVLVLEKTIHGGQIINTFSIGNWPGDYKVSGVELMGKVHEQAAALGAEIKYEEVTDVLRHNDDFIVKTEEGEYSAGAVILAVGATSRKLELEHEDKYAGRGVSYCATCDGAFYKEKDVAVIGGGNTALYDALYLANIARKVYLVHRRSEFRGDKFLVDKLGALPNVEFVLGYEASELIGDKKITGISLKRNDSLLVTKELPEEIELSVSGVFVAIGEKPLTESFSDLVKLDEKGYIVAGEDCVTSCPGVFVAGDCRTKTLRQLVTAAADGAVAANAATKYLS